ncbi:hypothetical protein Hdeb2414_s0014g00423961 [Helianthus debilis subsp. tardiflorus]
MGSSGRKNEFIGIFGPLKMQGLGLWALGPSPKPTNLILVINTRSSFVHNQADKPNTLTHHSLPLSRKPGTGRISGDGVAVSGGRGIFRRPFLLRRAQQPPFSLLRTTERTTTTTVRWWCGGATQEERRERETRRRERETEERETVRRERGPEVVVVSGGPTVGAVDRRSTSLSCGHWPLPNKIHRFAEDIDVSGAAATGVTTVV